MPASKIQGADQMRRRMRRFSVAGPFQRALGRILHEEAELFMPKSVRRTPVDTGALRNSATVPEPELIGSVGVVQEMGYGSTAVDYAIPVHERLDVHHPVGEAKYLERPFLEERPAIVRRIGFDVQAEIVNSFTGGRRIL